jgi:hypothetical protein
LVGIARFERATPWSQTRCATKLRHIPLARTEGLEPTSRGFGDHCSSWLSYVRIEPVASLELAPSIWKTDVQPVTPHRLVIENAVRREGFDPPSPD